jgi:membrane protease YdiL (CAAX protease family)
MDKNELEEELINDQDEYQTLTKSAYPDLNDLVKLFFVMLFYMLIVGIIEGIFVMNTLQFHSLLLNGALNLLGYIISLLIIIRYAIKKTKKRQGPSFSIGFNKIQAWLVPVIIISTLALFVGIERVAALIPMPASVQKFFERMITKDAFSLINLIVAAPILEEIFCRGIVLQGLLKNYSPTKAIIISAIFFGLIHLNPWQALPAFFGGLFLGWVYYKTQSVIPGMIIHTTINAMASSFLFLPHHQQSFLSLLGVPYYMLCVGAIFIFISGCLLIHKKALPVSG